MTIESDSMQALRDTSSLGLATAFIEREGRLHGEQRILRFWRGEFYRWDGVVYHRLEQEVFRAQVHTFLKNLKVRFKGAVQLFRPEPKHTKNVVETLAHECQAYVDAMPAWIDDHRPASSDIIAFKNGLLNLGDIIDGIMPVLIPPTPLWFSTIVIPYDFRFGAPCSQWTAFLDSSLRKDTQVDQGAIDLLQEWFGYCMTADTRHQKLMLLIGPPRCGKGTIIRAMQKVVGPENCASPKFSSLTQSFGLEPLIGKRVATVADAHLGRDDNAIGVLDTILQISGEDSVTINRKYEKAIAGVRLGVRFTIGANEPPDLPDTSAAIISRLLMITFQCSFVGKEDLRLSDKLDRETAGIAAWAIEGLKRLRKHGTFSEPDDGEQLRNDYLRQTAPVQAFLQDKCEIGSTDEHYCPVDELWAAWRAWATANGNIPGSKEGFGKRLRAAHPRIYKARKKQMESRGTIYMGLRLVTEGVLPFRPGEREID